MNRAHRLPQACGLTGLMLAICSGISGCMNLSGLSGSSSYACKAPDGVTCDSVSGTYANAVQNNLPSQRRRANTPAASGSPPASAPTASVVTPAAMTESIPATPVSLRSSPRILRLWFKPWEDADHDLYDQGYVYVQVDAGQWQIEHVQRQIRATYAPLKPPPRAAATEAKDGAALPTNLKSLPRPVDGAFPGTPSPVAPAPRSGDNNE
ncbi:TraV family lipoprotein [Sphaerotilus sp.]|uniref:TraV family lipoprotein n=1 Tax=Sphaerotilus sp. TaxID=2093942 RepID=UPI002ACE7EBC|nr:TraV family lipoprotein [Sphaerotilus sp.]MDZ7855937.1 TraV family lipoprotein [Sphaerotilus sp.]